MRWQVASPENCYLIRFPLAGSSASHQRRGLGAGVSQVADFDCPEEFGYYPHPTDCTQYYVCVFGGALLESCTGGLMYRLVFHPATSVTPASFTPSAFPSAATNCRRATGRGTSVAEPARTPIPAPSAPSGWPTRGPGRRSTGEHIRNFSGVWTLRLNLFPCSFPVGLPWTSSKTRLRRRSHETRTVRSTSDSVSRKWFR